MSRRSKRSQQPQQVIVLQQSDTGKNKKTYATMVPQSHFYAQESWLVRYWRPAAAWTYLLICVFDFIIMPVYTQKTNLGINDIIIVTDKLRPEDKVSAMNVLIKKNEWEPLTLAGGGMFHIAFGAILGVAAWTRGRVQEASIQNGYFPFEEPQIPTMAMPLQSVVPMAAQSAAPAAPAAPPQGQQPMQPTQPTQPTQQASAQQPLPSQPPPFDPTKSQYNNPG